MPEVTSGGAKISYDAVGEGRPLVLLHGWCCDRSWWTEPGYVDELRSDHRLVNVDIRGHGASEKPYEAAAYTEDALTADVFGVAEAEGLDRFAIWGQSYGGWISWMAAAADPERVPAIVTSGSAKVAATIPNGESLRLPGLGHGGACAASTLTVPTARAFLDRWVRVMS